VSLNALRPERLIVTGEYSPVMPKALGMLVDVLHLTFCKKMTYVVRADSYWLLHAADGVAAGQSASCQRRSVQIRTGPTMAGVKFGYKRFISISERLRLIELCGIATAQKTLIGKEVSVNRW
jgi:hypothetical protein